MDEKSVTSLWGNLKYGAIRPCPGDSDFVDLVIDGNSVRLRANDPALKELSPYRLNGKKKVLVIFWQTPDKHHHVYAVYVTDSKRLVDQIYKIMVDDEMAKHDRLVAKRPRYIAF